MFFRVMSVAALAELLGLFLLEGPTESRFVKHSEPSPRGFVEKCHPRSMGGGRIIASIEFQRCGSHC